MKSFRKIIKGFNKVADVLDEISAAVCVLCLTIQVVTVLVLVVGRYFFSVVPQGTEELCILCMVWIALLSTSLCIRDDTHMKMDILDMFASPRVIDYIKLLDAVILIVFSIMMIKYGLVLWKLKFGSHMSGLPLSGAWYYASLPISGVLNTFSAIVFFFTTLQRIIDSDEEGK